MLVLLLAHACRLGHSAAGNSAGSLCAAACYDRSAARVSRLTRAVRSFCLAAACASNPDLNDEQSPSTATLRLTEAVSHIQIEDQIMSHKASLACTGAFAGRPLSPASTRHFSHTIVGNRVFPETLGIQHVVIVHLGRALGPGTYSLSWLVGSIDTPTTHGTSASRSPKAEAGVWLRRAKGGRTPLRKRARKPARCLVPR